MELLYQPSDDKFFSLVERELFNIFIMTEDCRTLFPNDILFKDMDDSHQKGLSNLMRSMELLAKDMGGQELNSIQIGRDKFFLEQDEITNISFIYKTDKKVKEKSILRLLDKIKNCFLNHFTGNFTVDEVEKVKIMHHFVESLIKILEKESKTKNVLKFF